MSLLLTAVISALGIISGKLVFKKWTNHLTFYCLIMEGLVFLYELKLLPYPDIIPIALFLLVSAFLSFLFGILTVITARNLGRNDIGYFGKNNLTLTIISDNGSVIKYSIIFFGI